MVHGNVMFVLLSMEVARLWNHVAIQVKNAISFSL